MIVGMSAVVACGDDEGAATTSGSGGQAGATTATGAGGEDASSSTGAGGGASETTALPFGSGTRLRAVVHDFGGGALLRVGVHDAELEARCTFSVAADGQLRCLPEGSTVYFADGSCTEPVLVEQPCFPSEYGIFAAPSDDACIPWMTTTYRKTSARSGVSELFESLDGQCVSLGVPTGDVFDAEEVAPETFVAVEETTEVLTADLGRHILLADDGAYVASGARDEARDAACNALWFGGSRACIPTNVAYETPGRSFADASCEVPAAATYGCASAPSAVLRLEPAECETQATLLEIGEKLERGYDTNSGSCAESTEANYFRVGPALSTDDYPQLDVVELGSGRVRLEGVGAAGIWVDPLAQPFDSELGPCSATIAFGSLRCVPGDTVVQTPNLFSDEACTAPLLLWSDDGCSTLPAFVAEYASDDGCGAGLGAVYRVGGAYEGLVYADFDGGCEPTADPGEPLYLYGEAMAAEDFAPVTERVE